MSPLNTATASPGGNGLNEASLVATGFLSANGEGEVGAERELSRAQFRDFLHFFKVRSKFLISFLKMKCITALLHKMLVLILATNNQQAAQCME